MTRSFRFPAAAAALSLALGCARVPEPGIRMHDVRLPVQSFLLSNGLQVIVEEDHTRPVAGIVSVIGAGSANDPAGKEGLAHYLEHLSFRSRPNGHSELGQLLDYAGVGDRQGVTRLDDTVYWEFGPSASLDSLVALEAGRLNAPLQNLAPEVVEVERGVVRNETLQRDESGLGAELRGWIASAEFAPGHPYSHVTSGTPASVAAITLDDVQKFAASYYKADRTTWVISGDVTLAQAQMALARAFPNASALNASPPRHPQAPEEVAAPPAHPLYRAEAQIKKPTLFVAWPIPGTVRGSSAVEEFEAAFVEAYANIGWGDDVDGTLAMILPGEQASVMLLTVELKPDADPERAFKSVVRGVGYVSNLEGDSHPFARVQAAEITELGAAVEDFRARAIRRAEDAHGRGDAMALSHALGAISHLTRDEISGFADKYLSADRARALYLTPSKTAAATSIPKPTGYTAAGDEANVQFPDSTVRSVMHPFPAEEVRRTVLPNGLELLIEPRQHWPQVTVALSMPGGADDSTPGAIGELARYAFSDSTDHGSAGACGALVKRSLHRDSTVLVETAADGNLDNLLGILLDRVRSTRFALGNRKELLKAFDEVNAEPDAHAEQEMSQALFKDAALHALTHADLQKVSDGTVNDWLDQVYHPDHAVLAIVGDIDPEEARLLATEWMSQWKPGKVAPPSLPRQLAATGNRKPVVVPHEHAQQEDVALSCAAPISSAKDAVAFEVLSELLAHQLDQAARETIGASYGFISSQAMWRTGVGQISVEGMVENAQFTPVLSALHRQWATLGLRGFSQSELDRARWSLARRYDLRFISNRDVALELVQTHRLGFGVDSLAKYPELLLELTPADLKKAAAQCKADAAIVIEGDATTASDALKAVWP